MVPTFNSTFTRGQSAGAEITGDAKITNMDTTDGEKFKETT